MLQHFRLHRGTLGRVCTLISGVSGAVAVSDTAAESQLHERHQHPGSQIALVFGNLWYRCLRHRAYVNKVLGIETLDYIHVCVCVYICNRPL